jgi:two-component sensor histidine kinase
METKHSLRDAWRAFFVLKSARSEPLWARLLISAALALGVGLMLMLVSVLLYGRAEMLWWMSSLEHNVLVGVCAGSASMVLLRGLELALPSRFIDALSERRDWRPIAFVSAVLVLGSALGGRFAYALLGQIHNFDMWKKLSGIPMIQLKFLIFVMLVVAANWVWWLLRMKENALSHQATESQLRMLQAQIEPHFLFNTLANVQSLIASDAPRAQLMLASFTDYLRASLGQMRCGDSTLDAELDTAHNYLLLMQIRMGSRLTFSIDADVHARTAVMPPLLLQPLVENAIQHGLESKVEGGHVAVSASVADGIIQIRVDDDGHGDQPARRPARNGSGVGLTNIRARLQTRYGSHATFHIERAEDGSRAVLSLPFQASPAVPTGQPQH